MPIFLVERRFRDGSGNGGEVYTPSREYLHQQATGMMATKHGPIYFYGLSKNPTIETYYCEAENAESLKEHHQVKRWIDECKKQREYFKQNQKEANLNDCWEELNIYDLSNPHRILSRPLLTEHIVEGLTYF